MHIFRCTWRRLREGKFILCRDFLGHCKLFANNISRVVMYKYYWIKVWSTFSWGEFEFVASSILGKSTLFSKVSSEANHVDVFLDIVHDFCLKEGLKIISVYERSKSSYFKYNNIYIYIYISFIIHITPLQTCLCGVVHNFVAQLGLCNVFTELFNARALWWWSIFIDDFIAFSLACRPVLKSTS